MSLKMHPQVVVRKEIKVWWQATEEVLREGEADDDGCAAGSTPTLRKNNYPITGQLKYLQDHLPFDRHLIMADEKYRGDCHRGEQEDGEAAGAGRCRSLPGPARLLPGFLEIPLKFQLNYLCWMGGQTQTQTRPRHASWRIGA